MSDIKEILSEKINKYGKTREALLPIMRAVIEQKQYLSNESMIEIAEQLDISSAEVYGTASFYAFTDTEERGRYVIRLCKSIIAEMKGKKEILQTLEHILKIKIGETTPDKLFTLLETNDIGWSDKEPSMLINDVPYLELTPDKVIKIIKKLKLKA